MAVNMEVSQEIRYVLSKVVQSIPYYSTTAYIDNCDQGVALAVQGLKTLNSDPQYRISVMQVMDGYVFSVPYDSMKALLTLALNDSKLIDDNWVYTCQMREENETTRFKNEFASVVQQLSAMAYIQNIVEKVNQVMNLDLQNTTAVVSSLAACLAENGGAYNDQNLSYLSNITQNFNQMLLGMQQKDQRFQQGMQLWLQTCKQYYDYMAQNTAFYNKLQSAEGSYILNVGVAGVTQQTTTTHRNVTYDLYGVTMNNVMKVLSSFNYPYATISVIGPEMGTEAFDIMTMDKQGRSIIKQCCPLCDSGNGVLLRIMITPTRKMVT